MELRTPTAVIRVGHPGLSTPTKTAEIQCFVLIPEV